MEENKEDTVKEGITFGEFFGAIKKFLVWVLLASIVCATIAALLTVFVFNRGKETYSMSFYLHYPQSEEQVLPDGTPFRYETIAYPENLERAKNSSESFAKLDIASMTAENGIRVTAATEQKNENTTVYTGMYTVSVSGKYFQDAEQASAFLRALVGSAAQYVLSKVETNGYAAAISAYGSVRTYGEQIECLVAQRDFLVGQYGKYLSRYENKAIGGKSLKEHSADVLIALSDETVSHLKKDLQANGYLLRETESDILVSVKALENEAKRNSNAVASLEAELDKLYEKYDPATGVSDTFEAFHTRIATLIERNAEIETEIETLYHSIGYEKSGEEWVKTGTSADDSAFSAELNGIYETLLAQTDTCRNVVESLYGVETYATCEQEKASVVRDGTNVALVTVATFIIGFALFSVIAYAFGRRKSNKTVSKESLTVSKKAFEEE